MQAILLAVALLGHGALWVGLVNRIHSTGMPRWLVKGLSLVCLAAVLAIPLVLSAIAILHVGQADSAFSPSAFLVALWALGVYYFVPCIALATVVTAIWVKRQITYRPPTALRSHRIEPLKPEQSYGAAPIHGTLAALYRRLPYNQVVQLRVEQRELVFSRLPAALDGFSIAHLSDFHFTGRVGIEYFQEVVRQTNGLAPDLIAITGDLVDHAPYIDWLPETLGRLRAEAGVYFIFGNHDLRTRDLAQLRATLAELGLIDLGGKWQQVHFRGESLLLAGNELPWITPAADMRTCISAAVGMEHDRPFRVLLAHSPDQFGWAQRWDFDLMLAGHTHGGQFCLPWIGPLLTPCWHGVQYSSGTFAAGRTVMQVSRGVSSEVPLRWNCPPELSKIVLRTS
jgi:predicted MPP superfamily phosphohydrolase